MGYQRKTNGSGGREATGLLIPIGWASRMVVCCSSHWGWAYPLVPAQRLMIRLLAVIVAATCAMACTSGSSRVGSSTPEATIAVEELQPHLDALWANGDWQGVIRLLESRSDLTDLQKQALASARENVSYERATATAEAGRSATVIKGLTHADLSVNLERRGFKCSATQGQTMRVYRCEASEAGGLVHYDVQYMGANAQNISQITAAVLQYGVAPNDRIAAEFLGYIASIPYDGARPADTRRWAETNVGNDAETIVASARFEMRQGNPRARSLVIAAAGLPR